MRCPRCQSLLISEVFVDYEADGGTMSFLGSRCLICGDILDATTLRHRAAHRKRVIATHGGLGNGTKRHAA